VSERVPVVLDVDTGVDDACAILLATLHPRLDLRAVTCVAGNVGVDQVVRNTLIVLAAAGRSDVPVARGAARHPAGAGARGPARARAGRAGRP
jgi:pyrimidine-specific ribonucleoside hydrolase